MQQARHRGGTERQTGPARFLEPAGAGTDVHASHRLPVSESRARPGTGTAAAHAPLSAGPTSEPARAPRARAWRPASGPGAGLDGAHSRRGDGARATARRRMGRARPALSQAQAAALADSVGDSDRAGAATERPAPSHWEGHVRLRLASWGPRGAWGPRPPGLWGGGQLLEHWQAAAAESGHRGSEREPQSPGTSAQEQARWLTPRRSHARRLLF
jgi:hypothetical protein